MSAVRVGVGRPFAGRIATLSLGLCLAAGPLHAGWFGRGDAAPSGILGAFRLEQRFEPGQEFVYSFSSQLDQSIAIAGRDLSYAMTLTGTARQVVADVDARRGVALIGQLALSQWERQEGSAATPVASKEQTWNSAWRIDRAGRSLRRAAAEAEGDAARNDFLQTVSQLGESAQACAPFPAPKVRVGSQWRGPVLLPLPGMRLPGEGLSTVVEAGLTNGGRFCVIRTDVPAESWQAHSDWLPDAHTWLPDIVVAGYSLGVFDLDRGVWQSLAWDLRAQLGGRGFEGVVRIRSATRLAAAGRLPRAAAAEWRDRIRDYDTVVARLYATNGVADALAIVGHLQKVEKDPDWLRGLALTAAMLDPGHRVGAVAGFDTQGEARETTPQRTGMGKADVRVQAQQWPEAVAAYRAVADDYPDDDLAPQALAAAAYISDTRLGDAAGAVVMRDRVVAWREARAERSTNRTDRALDLYRLAGAYAEAGQAEKAAAAYARCLDSLAAAEHATLRVLAQYRLARLREALGPRDQARSAYEAVLATAADEDYSAKLKGKARERIERLKQDP